MKKPIRAAAVLCAFSALTLGMSSILAARPVSRPAPKPPVLCGCLCPDGSFITTSAQNPNGCARACSTACNASSGEF